MLSGVKLRDKEMVLMINLDKGLCQIILYCKGWFKTTDPISDLKVLIGKRCGYDPELCSLENIYWHLCEIIKECNDIHPNKNYIYQEILREMFKWETSITINDVVKQLRSQISLLPVLNKDKELILDLGEPDYTWLPKK